MGRLGVYLVVLLIGAGVISGAFWAGKLYERAQWEVAESEALLTAKEDARVAESEIARLKGELDATRSIIQGQRNQLDEVIQNVSTPEQTVDSPCNVLHSARIMLNEQRGYPLGTDQNPELSSAQVGEASCITGSMLLRESAGCELDYRELMEGHNKLVDIVRGLPCVEVVEEVESNGIH